MSFLLGFWFLVVVVGASTEPNTPTMLEQYLAGLDSFEKFWKGVYGLMTPHYKNMEDVLEYKKKDLLQWETHIHHFHTQAQNFPSQTAVHAPSQPELVVDSPFEKEKRAACGDGILGSGYSTLVCLLLFNFRIRIASNRS